MALADTNSTRSVAASAKRTSSPGLLHATVAAVKAETGRVLLMLRRYPIGTLATAAILSLVFVGIFETGKSMFASGEISQQELSGLVQTFILWSALITGFGGIAGSIRDETKSGLIEILWMGRLPAVFILVLRSVLSCCVVLIMCTLIAIILSILYSVPEVVTLDLIIAILFVMPAAIGIGLVFGAIIILFKDIGPSVNLLQFLLLPVFMAYDGFALPIAVLPGLTGLDALACAACGATTWIFVAGIPLAWFVFGVLSCAVAVRMSKKRALVYEY